MEANTAKRARPEDRVPTNPVETEENWFSNQLGQRRKQRRLANRMAQDIPGASPQQPTDVQHQGDDQPGLQPVDQACDLEGHGLGQSNGQVQDRGPTKELSMVEFMSWIKAANQRQTELEIARNTRKCRKTPRRRDLR